MSEAYAAGTDLVPIGQVRLETENMIENWLARQPDLLDLELLIIGSQVTTDFGVRIDLFGLDAEGNVIIVELKRDRTPRERRPSGSRLR